MMLSARSVRIVVTHSARALKFVCLRTLHLERYEPPRLAPSLRAQRGKNPERLPEICARARHAIQERQIQLATFSRIHDEEIGELEAALRHPWKIEEKNRKP
jgi:hypothetical protein